MKSTSLDHLVGAGKECGWDSEAERLGRLDNELVLGRRLHRQVGWLLALEVDAMARSPICSGNRADGGSVDVRKWDVSSLP